MSPFRFVDLFAGLGGFHLAMRRYGGECVFASEIDSRLQDLYEKNFGIRPAGDLKRVPSSSVPRHDILCAGFPCQPFSKAGDQDGLRDRRRGTLLYDVLRIVADKLPSYLILENVPNFVRHQNGKTYEWLISQLNLLGYSTSSKELSPHEFGVPQVRRRMYLVGQLGTQTGFTWPSADAAVPDLRSLLDSSPPEAKALTPQAIRCIEIWQDFLCRIPDDVSLSAFPIWSMEFGATYPVDKGPLINLPLSRLRSYRGIFGKKFSDLSRSEIIQALPAYSRGEKDDSFPRWKQKYIVQNRNLFSAHKSLLTSWIPLVKRLPPSLQKFEWNCSGEPRDIWRTILQFRASGLRSKRALWAPSLVAMTVSQVPIVAWERRFLTILECAKLQSLDGLSHLPEGIPGYKAMGNAVNVTVVEAVVGHLLRKYGGTARSAAA